MPKRLSKPTEPIKPKRPRDINQFAHALGRLSTQESEAPTIPRSEISRVMAEMGRKGGKISGARRKENLSPEKRVEIALKAAKTRWAKTKQD